MKQQWTLQELIDHWTITHEEKTQIARYHTEPNQVGFALLLKYFQVEGKFPQRKQDVPRIITEHIAQQLGLQVTALESYRWERPTIDRHRTRIRTFLGVRGGTVDDVKTVSDWLSLQTQLLEAHNLDRLEEATYEQYRTLKIEPPQATRMNRLIRSAVRTADERFYAATFEKLRPETRKRLEALLTIDDKVEENTSALFALKKSEAGVASLESMMAEISKLERIVAMDFPNGLFVGISRKRLLWCKQRIAVGDLHEIRHHPPAIRYSLLAAFCYERKMEITDTLLELLISIVHKISSRAEHRIDRQVIKDVKKVRDKGRILYDVAAAAVDHPEGTIKDVIYPVAGEQTLRDVIQEFKASGSYDQRVQALMRGSYGNHYRRMVPTLLKAVTLCSTNEASKPMLTAISLITTYADKKQASYDETEVVLLSGIVPDKWLPLVKQGARVNRISYELCVLKAVRDKLRCKEMYAQGAYRYRNPDEDLPADFDAKQTSYYADLNQPLSADEFIVTQQQDMKAALAKLDKGIVKNPKVDLTTRAGKSWITVGKLDPQPEPRNLASLKAEVGRRWEQLYLLDILKEADMRIGFTNLFKSPTPHEALPREALQRRLLLCLYGLGTNTGM